MFVPKEATSGIDLECVLKKLLQICFELRRKQKRTVCPSRVRFAELDYEIACFFGECYKQLVKCHVNVEAPAV
jgi:hypothetical protein